MNLFEWLLVGHLIGDFLLQTRWMADNKANRLLPLVIHSLVYTAAVFACSLPVGGIRFSTVVLVLITHMMIDKRNLVLWWVTHVNKSPDMFWLQIINDQIFHLLVLVLVVYLN